MSPLEMYPRILREIQSIAEYCGRDPREINLVAVTKGHSSTHLLPAYEAGCRDFGENKVQEALEKILEFPPDLRWHLIGTLQKNKVRKVIGRFHLIHSVDSIGLVNKISQCSAEEGVETSVLLQVNTSGEKTKHGFTPIAVKKDIQEILSFPGIAVKGFMTMAPNTDDKEVIRKCFQELRYLRDQLRVYSDETSHLRELSMGMTHDYAIAIKEGATILRIGTAIFGGLQTTFPPL